MTRRWTRQQWAHYLAHNVKGWLVPQVRYGRASWCGRFLIIAAPRYVSRRTGHGEIGLEWFRWREKR